MSHHNGKLPGLSDRKIIQALRKAGFAYAPRRGKGSHKAFVKKEVSGKIRLVIIPKREHMPMGTLGSILEQAGLSRDDFLDLL